MHFVWEPIHGYSEEPSSRLGAETVRMFLDGSTGPFPTGVGDQPFFCNFMHGLTSYTHLDGFAFFKDEDEEDVSVNLAMLKLFEVRTSFFEECEKAFADAHTPRLKP